MTNSSTFIFQKFNQDDIEKFYTKREYEIKIGEKVQLQDTQRTKFVVLGIEEDLGPQINGGRKGARNAFSYFLQRFLSMQSNEFLIGDEIVILGSIKQTKEFEDVDLNTCIIELDDLVFDVLNPFITRNIIPIVVGGGHNNAYPLIKLFSNKFKKAINVVNLDAHADTRFCDVRHSGNPFSFAMERGYLNKYYVLGLHHSYNNQYIIEKLNENSSFYTWYDDYINDILKFEKDINFVVFENENEILGLELDLDAIAYMPSSALSPTGFTIEQARFYIKNISNLNNLCYIHLPEGAPTNDQEGLIVGKALAYLVSDFIKTKKHVK